MICKKCGEDKKYYAKGMCKKCYHATLYKTNPNEYKLRFNKWRKANPEKARLQSERSNRKQGKLPISENPECSSWLGVHIAEQVLHKTFKNVVKKPYGFPGYDFICNKGMKIDVKAACLCANHGKQTQWLFAIRKNITADYFLCIAFDNRKTLTPLHLWLIPGNIINHLSAVSISISTVNKWKKYELDLTKTTECCNKMKIKEMN